MKSLKSLFTFTALAFSISSVALANENPLASLKEAAKDNVKTAVTEKVKSVTNESSATKNGALEKITTAKENATDVVSSAKEKASQTVSSVKEKVNAVKEKTTSLKQSASAEKSTSLKEKASETLSSAKAKAKSVMESAKVNINNADAATLQKLSGIGEKKAQAIIDYRNKVGKIKDISELSKIDGLGTTTIEKIAPLLSF